MTNGTHIIFSAHADSFSEVYVSDLIHPPRVIGGSGGLISSVQVASDGSVAWLEDQGGGNELWLFNKTLQRIKTGVEADSVIVSDSKHESADNSSGKTAVPSLFSQTRSYIRCGLIKIRQAGPPFVSHRLHRYSRLHTSVSPRSITRTMSRFKRTRTCI